MRTEQQLKNEFKTPKEVSDAIAAFPARVVGSLLPHRKELPEEFREYDSNHWCDIAAIWFFSGLPQETKFHTKEGVDGSKAIRHLGTCLRSFEPSHEEKMGGVGFLMSLWFDKIEIPEQEK